MRLWRRIELILKESPIPVSTPSIVAMVGDIPNARCQVWDALATMAKAGLVERVIRTEKREAECARRRPFQARRKVAYWTLTTRSEQRGR